MSGSSPRRDLRTLCPALPTFRVAGCELRVSQAQSKPSGEDLPGPEPHVEADEGSVLPKPPKTKAASYPRLLRCFGLAPDGEAPPGSQGTRGEPAPTDRVEPGSGRTRRTDCPGVHTKLGMVGVAEKRSPDLTSGRAALRLGSHPTRSLGRFWAVLLPEPRDPGTQPGTPAWRPG